MSEFWERPKATDAEKKVAYGETYERAFKASDKPSKELIRECAIAVSAEMNVRVMFNNGNNDPSFI